MTRPSPLANHLAAWLAVAALISGCLAPARLSTVSTEPAPPAKGGESQLKSARITADEVVDLAEPHEPAATIERAEKSVLTVPVSAGSGAEVEPPVSLGVPHVEATLLPAPLAQAAPQPVPPPPAASREVPARNAGYAQVPEVLAPSGGSQLGIQQRAKPIQQISLNIAPPVALDNQRSPLPPPPNVGAEALPLLAQERPFVRGSVVGYTCDLRPAMPALNFCYQPLYFEEVNVERYGRSYGMLQPVVSAAHFYSGIHLLPYRLFAQPARRCTYHAHWTLPGYRIPVKEHEQPTASLLGGTAQAAVAYGIFVLFP